nr:MAG TPA: Sperm-activating peptide [Caudoviricetes sp.]
MARKTKALTIADEGRDQGKVFILREMPASQAEKWAMRALLSVARSGIDIGQAASQGMQGIALMGVSALLSANWDDAEPLLDEMMSCIEIRPDPAKVNIVRALIEDDIEEVMTRIKLRQEVLELHVGFSLGGGGSS